VKPLLLNNNSKKKNSTRESNSTVRRGSLKQQSISIALKEKSVDETIEDDMTEVSDSFRGSMRTE
jgi:hypothetical protein